MTLHKVSSHVEYGLKLIEDAKGKLAELKAKRGKVMASLDAIKFVMKPKEGRPDLIDIDLMSKELERLQCKIDAQKNILQVLRDTCGGSEAGEAEKAKLTLVDDAWANAKSRQELWRRHRDALQSQLHGMKAVTRGLQQILPPSPRFTTTMNLTRLTFRLSRLDFVHSACGALSLRGIAGLPPAVLLTTVGVLSLIFSNPPLAL